jgi:hypothetical protein
MSKAKQPVHPREILAARDIPQAAYVTLQAAARYTSIGAGMLLKLAATDATFPRLIVVSERKRVFRLDELVRWMESQRGQPTARKKS